MTIKASIPFPNEVTDIISCLREDGHEAYAVGGAIRDALMGLLPHDWDLASSARPGEAQACLEGHGYRVSVGNGLKHGTVTVRGKTAQYELTTFRVESGYSDARHPDSVAYSSSLLDDLSRRDFTMNAIAARPLSDGSTEIVDPYGGTEDIRHGSIRCVGDPVLRFEEDALRIMRALRFAAVYGFSVESSTALAAARCARRLDMIARERITAELFLLLEGRHAGTVADRFADVLSRAIHADLSKNASFGFQLVREPADRLAYLLSGMSPGEAVDVCVKLRCRKSVSARVFRCLTWASAPLPTDHGGACRLLSSFDGHVGDFLLLYQALHPDDNDVRRVRAACDEILRKGDCWHPSMLEINGEDLLRMGYGKGAVIGDILLYLYDEVISLSVRNERNDLLVLARKAFPIPNGST